MNVGGVAGAAGGIIAGATQVARNGCESVALFMLVGWAAGSAVGLATGLGGMAWGVKAGGASMAVGTALSAMGLNGISGGVSHLTREARSA